MNTLAALKHSSLRLEPLALALAAVLSLSACGGGGGGAPVTAAVKPDAQGIAVGEPNPSAPVDKDAFTRMAQGAACSDKLNRLYIIDNAQVFWDVAGSCADASYSHALYGPTPELKRCSAGDTIAGPRTSCTDERYRDTFDTIVKNRDKADLGLGATHKIEVVDLTPQPKLGNTVKFERLTVNSYSFGIGVENLAVRDAKEWSALWKRLHQPGVAVTPSDPAVPIPSPDVPPEPAIDFDKKMVVAILAGNGSSGCANVGVVRTSEQDGALHVEYSYAPEPGPGTACLAVITPLIDLVVVDKHEQVKFEQIKAAPVDFKRVEAKFSGADTSAPFNAVVTDAQKLGKLWSQYVDPATPLPAVDFSRQTVLFAWGGLGMTCQSTAFTGVSRAGGKLYAFVTDSVPGPATLCAQGVKGAGDVIVIERGNEPVVFSASVTKF